jgi:CRP-like cAMP-binding protein
MTSSNQKPLATFLARLTRRSKLNQEEQEAILTLPSQAEQVMGRADIVRPGDRTEHSTLVGRGIVARYDQMANGKRQIVNIYFRGDMCDLHSVPCPVAGWGLMAMTTSMVLKVTHADLRSLAIRYPAIAMAFWRDTTVDGSIIAKWTANLGRQPAAQRLAHFLCETGVRLDDADCGRRDQFDLPLTQEQLADITGLTSVHINRTLQELRGAGLIETSGQTRVPDWDRLCSFADFDPTYLLRLKQPI